MLEGNKNVGWRRAGGSGHGCLGLTPGLEHKVDVISQARSCDMQGRHQQTDPTNLCIPTSLQPVAPTGLGRGPVALPGKGAHHVRGLQRHYSIPEPSQSAGR